MPLWLRVQVGMLSRFAATRARASGTFEATSARSYQRGSRRLYSESAIMLVPRPETSTPTGTRSTMMSRAPRVPRRPGTARAGDGAALGSGFDAAERQNSFTFFLKILRNVAYILWRDDDRHADPAIEGARHFLRLDMALRLEEGHQPRLGPSVGVDPGMEAVGQHARDILDQPAAGDVGQSVDAPGPDQREERLHVDAGGGEQRLDQQPFLVEQSRAVELPPLVGREAADQREAVRMHARRRQPEDEIAFRHPVPGQRLAPLHRADAKAGEIVVARRVHAWHFRRLAADQRAARLPAPGGDRGDHPLGNAALELRAGEIIEEEERLGALHDEVVDAHCDEVDADALV